MKKLPALFVLAALALAAWSSALADPSELTTSLMTLNQVSPGGPGSNVAYDAVFSPWTGAPVLLSANGFGDGYAPASTDCLTGCSLPSPAAAQLALQAFQFSKPVSYASIEIATDSMNPAFAQAFNSAGQLIGYCSGISGAPPLLSGKLGLSKRCCRRH